MSRTYLWTLASAGLTLVAAASPSWAEGANGGGDYVALRLIGGASQVDGIEDSQGGSIQRVTDSDETGGSGIALGYDWSGKGLPIRTELEYHYRHRFDLDFRAVGGANLGIKNNLQTHVLLLSAVYELPVLESWTLYLGGGVGMAINVSNVEARNLVTSATEETEDPEYNLTWSGMVGATYAFNPSWKVELGYRYSDLGSVLMGPFSNGAEITADYRSHDVVLAVQYHF